MWPEPDDRAVTQRMRAAHSHARAALHVAEAPDRHEAWGWQGRTLGKSVTTPGGPAWLRVASAPANEIIGTFWDGAIQAQRLLPPSIPRPALRRWHDWSEAAFGCRSELYEYIPAAAIATHAVITAPPDLPAGWWTAARVALDTIAAVTTTRVTIQPGFLAWAMPHYLGISPANVAAPRWTTAHGDFTFANLCAPTFSILDWEGWGLAPPGYDAAMLHSYSLLTPATADRIERELAPLLNSTTGRYAELTVITELLYAAANGINRVLVEPLRRRAASILGRAMPGT